MSVYDLEEFYVHTILVELPNGQDGEGVDQFLTGVNLIGWLSGSQKLVRDANGNQILSPATFTTYPLYAAMFALDARITAGGVLRRVLGLNNNDSGTLDLPDNLEVNLI